MDSSIIPPGSQSYLDLLTFAGTVDACLQRSQFLHLENGAATRYEPVSPYPTYTKQQLDMRRKWEVLQYKQTNTKMTKSAKWSRLVSNNNKRSCTNNIYAATPSTACNVPGPATIFSLDQNVPLYMYYPQISYVPLKEIPFKNDTNVWNVYPVNDVFVNVVSTSTSTDASNNVITNYNSNYEIISYQTIIKPIYATYSITMNIPVSISIEGYSNVQDNAIYDIIVTITSAVLHVFYSTTEVTNVALDLGYLQSLHITISSTPGAFSASQYVGNLLISPYNTLILDTLPQYVYTYKLEVAMETNISPETTSLVSNLKIKTVANITGVDDVYYNSAQNCFLDSAVNRDLYVFPKYELSGTGAGGVVSC